MKTYTIRFAARPEAAERIRRLASSLEDAGQLTLIEFLDTEPLAPLQRGDDCCRGCGGTYERHGRGRGMPAGKVSATYTCCGCGDRRHQTEARSRIREN